MGDPITILIGRIDGDLRPGVVNHLVDDVRRGTGASAPILVVPDNGEICFYNAPGFVIHLRYYRPDNEPWQSHPFTVDIEILDRDLDHRAYAEKAYDVLAETGRYRLMMLVADELTRSTHYPLTDW